MQQDRRITALAAGFVGGFALWTVAPRVLGRVPWDGGVAYLAALFAAGALVGWMDRVSVWTGPAGLYLGQVAAIVMQVLRASDVSSSPHPALHPLFLVPVTLCALAGAAAVAALPLWAAFEREAWDDREDAERP